MSFLLDPPLLVGCGAAAQAIAGDSPRQSDVIRAVTVGSFLGISLALYANVEPVARRWPLLGARSGREFMITSGLAHIDERKMTTLQHAAALSLFTLYPAWYELGRAVVRR